MRNYAPMVYGWAFIALLFCLFFNSTSAQDNKFLIRNFDRKDYNASVSNWDITQDNRGIIFISNYDGIITHDAKHWNHIPILDNLVALSISSDQNNRIFAGTQGDFGYLEPDQTGRLSYHSLANGIPEKLKLNGFWRIITTSKAVYFQSSELLAKWENGRLIFWKTTENKPFRYIFNINDTLYTTKHGVGIQKIISNDLNTLKNSDKLVEQSIHLICKENKDFLVGAQTGFFIYDSARTYKIKSPDFLNNNKLFTSKRITNHDFSFALGTLTGGLFFLDKDLNLLYRLGKDNGLPSDVVRNFCFDSSQNLWVATYEGISYTEIVSPLMFWNTQDIPGVPNSILRHNKSIYVGSSEGIYRLNNNKSIQIKDLNSNVWDICTYDSTVIIGSQDGLFGLSNEMPYEIKDYSGVTALLPIKNLYIPHLTVVHSQGISVLVNNNSTWDEVKNIKIASPTCRSLSQDKNENLWISAKFRGIYRIDNLFSNKLSHVIKYDTTSGLPDINEIKIIKKDDQLLFTTSKGFYRYNEQTNRFEPDSSILKERININNIVEDQYGNYIISVIDETRKTHVEILKKVGNEYVRDYIPFRRLPEMEITAIYPEGDYIWIAGGEGLFRFDRNVEKDYTIPFNTLVSQVSVRDSVIFYGNYYDPSDTTGVPPIILDQPEIFKPKLEFEDNSLTFNFSAAFYEAAERTLYSYYLENNEETWSKWSTNTTKEYNNLSAGTYTFHVKSKNIYDTEGRVASYEFTILPPWYQTGWAYFLFSVLAILFVWLIALLYTYRVRMQRRRLKLIVADRTYEVISQKKEIERQKDLLQLQFEKISKQKDSIEEKNSKLQHAQQETQNANEALQKLNTHLEKEVEKRTEKIKSTLHQLQLKNKELDTFIYRASHDLEGPISRISGLSALVKMTFPKGVDQQYIDLIEVTAKNMKVLISKLTQVHNLHNAKVKNELIDVTELIASITESLQHLENGCSINYKFDIPAETKIFGDIDLLTIVLQNIIENALVFRKPRYDEHQVGISVKKINDLAYITVLDNGTGIHADHIDKVFDMFYRGTNQSLGSGLGLYLAKMAIEHLEGHIEVRSELHKFTEFTVIIPQ
ncbi:ATP-binding protein [Fulvivirga ulvae]|uniref:ATP-binding protein n=1 Tax=Fulvivirga ulvae TaxID=2904245 RepID=UPI001F1941E6|nr:ATP-binding protein [Fulvivirga ulvae]UII30335.1 ATP-binding protein [Fulvivirga ulvae]